MPEILSEKNKTKAYIASFNNGDEKNAKLNNWQKNVLYDKNYIYKPFTSNVFGHKHIPSSKVQRSYHAVATQ